MFKRKNEHNVIVLGIDGAGKSAILSKLSRKKSMIKLAPTHGNQVCCFEQNGHRFSCNEIGGSKNNRFNWKTHYKSSLNAVIFVVDCSNRIRLEECGVIIQNLLQENKLYGLPFLVYGNKQDILTSAGGREIAEALNLHIIRDRAWFIQSCSAETGEGLSDGISWLTSTLSKNSKKMIAK